MHEKCGTHARAKYLINSGWLLQVKSRCCIFSPQYLQVNTKKLALYTAKAFSFWGMNRALDHAEVTDPTVFRYLSFLPNLRCLDKTLTGWNFACQLSCRIICSEVMAISKFVSLQAEWLRSAFDYHMQCNIGVVVLSADAQIWAYCVTFLLSEFVRCCYG